MVHPRRCRRLILRVVVVVARVVPAAVGGGQDVQLRGGPDAGEEAEDACGVRINNCVVDVLCGVWR